MEMFLVYQTDRHDFYRTLVNVAGGPLTLQPGHHGTPQGNLYNIVPKGSPVPEAGFYNPVYIKAIKGYGPLPVYKCFPSKKLEI